MTLHCRCRLAHPLQGVLVQGAMQCHSWARLVAMQRLLLLSVVDEATSPPAVSWRVDASVEGVWEVY